MIGTWNSCISRIAFVMALTGALFMLTNGAWADSRDTTIAGTEKFPIAGGGEVDGASILTRTRGGVGYTWSTRELAQDAPYTNWFVSFNNPKQCVKRCECSDEDFANPDVEIGVFWATGRFTDMYGQAEFSAEVDYGELPGGDDQVPFGDFANAIKRGAEIHLIARAHGPTVGNGEAQLTEFNGGCPPNPDGELGGCVDVQFSIHRSPTCKP